MFLKRIPYLGYEQDIFLFSVLLVSSVLYAHLQNESSQAVLHDLLSLNREAKGITSNSLFSNTQEKGSI